jgi:localization factor PodJL
MRYVPGHVNEVRPAVRDAASDAARRSGLSVSAAFAMIRKDIHELRRQASRPHVEPAVLEQRLHEITAQIDALQGSVPSRDGSGHGMEEFVAQLQALLAQNEARLAALQQQIAATAATAISGPAESIRRDVASLKEIQASVDRRTQDTFEAVYDTIERIVDRLASLEEELRDRHSGSQSDLLSAEPERRGAASARLTPPSEALASAPLEGGGMSIMLRQPAVPDRIAHVPARLAPVMVESGPYPPPAAPLALRFATTARRVARALAGAVAVGTLSGHSRLRGKAAVAGVGVVLATLFAVTFALDFYRSPAVIVADALPPGAEERAADVDPPDNEAARAAEPSSGQPVRQGVSQGSGIAAPAPGSANPLPDGPAAAQAAAVAAEPTAPVAFPGPADAARPDAEVSALMRNVLIPAPAGDPWRSAPSAAPDLTAMPLPPAMGSKRLVEAASAGDPDASYEIAIRFVQGRNAAPDFAMAAAWLDRAARAGLVPAQFRLGSMYEKGLGVRKDFAEARRLYVAAAAKGHAKAMHNLAVLYTGGIDGAPDFAAAAEWFRKAAAYGVVDSAYNLGILYARGSGVERDLAESYKWFALAAKAGDKDAVHKRDEVARGLDPKHLESARQAVEAFVATPQPDEATAVKAPPGGWDQVATAATTKSRSFARPVRFPGR